MSFFLFVIAACGSRSNADASRGQTHYTRSVLSIDGTKGGSDFLGDHAARERSYWIPGSYALALSEKHNSLFKTLKNKGFTEEKMAKIELYTISTSTTLEANKSLYSYLDRVTRFCLTA